MEWIKIKASVSQTSSLLSLSHGVHGHGERPLNTWGISEDENGQWLPGI